MPWSSFAQSFTKIKIFTFHFHHDFGQTVNNTNYQFWSKNFCSSARHHKIKVTERVVCVTPIQITSAENIFFQPKIWRLYWNIDFGLKFKKLPQVSTGKNFFSGFLNTKQCFLVLSTRKQTDCELLSVENRIKIFLSSFWYKVSKIIISSNCKSPLQSNAFEILPSGRCAFSVIFSGHTLYQKQFRCDHHNTFWLFNFYNLSKMMNNGQISNNLESSVGSILSKVLVLCSS